MLNSKHKYDYEKYKIVDGNCGLINEYVNDLYFTIPVGISTYCAFLQFRYASVGRLSRCNKGALKWKRVASGCLFFLTSKLY